jgi:hypothetical protein
VSAPIAVELSQECLVAERLIAELPGSCLGPARSTGSTPRPGSDDARCCSPGLQSPDCMSRDVRCYLLYVTLAVATGFADVRMRAHTDNVIKSYIPGVVAGTESAPGVYRVLVPFAIDGLARVTGMSLTSAWYLSRLLVIFLAYCAIHAYLRTWFAPEASLTGVLITAATLPLTFTNSWPHPDHIPELALFTLGAMAIARRLDAVFALALALAALNRETSVFLVVLYAVAEPWSRPRVIRLATFAAEWFVIYGGLRALRGLRHYEYWQAGRNLADLGLLPPAFDPYYRAYAYFGVILFAPLLYFAMRAVDAPAFARRALLAVPVVVTICFMFSSIIETRIFTPLYPLVLPAAVFFLFRAPMESGTQ